MSARDEHQPSRPGSPNRTSVDKLGDKLRRRYCKNFQKDIFLPHDALDTLLKKSAIRRVLRPNLQCADDDEIESMVAQILGDNAGPGYKRIFAILVLIEKVEYIEEFIDEKIRDVDLPVELNGLSERLKDCSLRYLDFFCDQQWKVNVPVLDFTSDSIPIKYDSYQVLPFLEKEHIGSDGYGALWKVRIHPDHIRGNKSQNSYFAVRSFELHRRSRWENEVEAFKRLRAQRPSHEHLINLLFAFEYRDMGFLIFPFADSNLDQYWKSNGRHPPSFEDAYWLIQQCNGLVAALCAVRDLDPWEPEGSLGTGGIEPKNILWFKAPETGRGRLVVADLTLGQFYSNRIAKNIIQYEHGWVHAYQSPEFSVHFNPQAQQRSDVWSLRCLFLEFIVWHLVGYAAIREKGDVRNPYGPTRQSFLSDRVKDNTTLFYRGAEDRFFDSRDSNLSSVKGSVTTWFYYLHESPACSEVMHAFLNLIENGMLRSDPGDRYTMGQVAEALTDIFERCSAEEYCIVGSPQFNINRHVYPITWRGIPINRALPQSSQIPYQRTDEHNERGKESRNNRSPVTTNQHHVQSQSKGSNATPSEESYDIKESEQKQTSSSSKLSTLLHRFKRG